jgi:hypothetical protein
MAVLEHDMARKSAVPDPPDERDRIDLRADPEFISRVKVQAKRKRMSSSAYIRQAVMERLEADEATARD